MDVYRRYAVQTSSEPEKMPFVDCCPTRGTLDQAVSSRRLDVEVGLGVQGLAVTASGFSGHYSGFQVLEALDLTLNPKP